MNLSKSAFNSRFTLKLSELLLYSSKSLNNYLWLSLIALSNVCSFNWALGLSTFGSEEVHKHSIIQNSLRLKISKHHLLNSWVTPLYKKWCFFISSPLRIYQLMNDGKSSKENGVWIYEISSDGITKLIRPLWVNTKYLSIWCIS